LVELLDLAPTIAEAAGLEIPYYNQGQSLNPVLNGETFNHRQSVRSEFYVGINYPDESHATMYRDERYKLITYHGKNLVELYDLHEDPWEYNDLSENLDEKIWMHQHNSRACRDKATMLPFLPISDHPRVPIRFEKNTS